MRVAKERALSLLQTGRGHALSADLLYRASVDEAHARGADPDVFSFNGTYSLSVFNLLGLGLELLLKAAITELNDDADEDFLRGVGHNLIRALDEAEAAGFVSSAPNLRELVEVLNDPFKLHWFRYSRPENFALPGDFPQVIQTVAALDEELRNLLWSEEDLAAYEAGDQGG